MIALGGCSSSTAAPLTGDDSNPPDDAAAASDSGSTTTGPHDSGGSHPTQDAACGVHVNSGIVYSSSGVPDCAANAPCDLTTSTCCVNGLGLGTCMSGHNGCGAGLNAAFECIEDTDCPGGEVCCGYADSTSSTAGSKCQDISKSGNKCTPAPSKTQGSVQFCQKTCECKDGSECVPQSCNVGLSMAAHLTMCGLQSVMPYNCTRN